MQKILVVDDAAGNRELLQEMLEDNYVIEMAENGQQALEILRQEEIQLVLLDISLPFFNGYHWCQEIRKISKAPILFLTSASDSVNLVMAMQMGGDDLLAKPFDLQVLSAKVQAMLRRAYDFAVAPALLTCGGAALNPANGTVTVNGQRVELTRNEGKLLQLLLEKKGQIVSRDAMMTALWESDSFVDENTLSVNVNRLRRKLEAAGLPDFIRTRKGAGYLVEESGV